MPWWRGVQKCNVVLKNGTPPLVLRMRELARQLASKLKQSNAISGQRTQPNGGPVLADKPQKWVPLH